MTVLKRISIVIPALWLGFVLAISFMEAWLKFQAEGVSIATGLSIGSLVFAALNKVELFFMAMLILVTTKLNWFKTWRSRTYMLVILLAIMLVQTLYLLPVLDIRAQQIIAGATVEKSYMHLYYIILEVIKVLALTVLSVCALRKYITENGKANTGSLNETYNG